MTNKAQLKGEAAYKAGLPVQANPYLYQPHKILQAAWLNGWYKEKRLADNSEDDG